LSRRPCAARSKAGEGVVRLAGLVVDARSAEGHWMESLFHATHAAGLKGMAAQSFPFSST
jgi:hypothetical protein